MLIKRNAEIENGKKIQIQKFADGRDVTLLGAFACGQTVEYRVRVPRALGVSAVVIRIAPDGEADRDLPLQYQTRDGACDVYTLRLDTAALCGERDSGLFYYEFLFLRGLDTLFSDSTNNVDFTLSPTSAARFHLLIYQADYEVPHWFEGGIMYHIFLDRFCRGEGHAELHAGARLDPDWENGIPQFAKRAGDPLSNDVFFGGNLWGVIEKLDELQKLGVTVLYLSPIFEANSNHRYDTGDYERVDALLGGDEAFKRLVEQAHARGIRVILDGVFNHTGDDSRYFNRRGNYAEVGACQSKESPYADWFSFRSYPNDYESWWGIEILPRLNHENADCRRYFTGEDGIAARWLRAGADGWRLDVADELSDAFLDELRETVKRESGGEAILIGEVWENAVEKIAYGSRRRYFSGRQLDSVMNYPFRNAVLAFLQRADARTFYNIVTELYASYPPAVSHALMNLLGTHDTERILTLLGVGENGGAGKSNAALATARLHPNRRALAVRLLKMASILQYTVFGVPSVYYGDETGLEGYHDPFCRMPYPWGREDGELLAHYRALGELRRAHPALCHGDFRFLYVDDSAFMFERRCDGDVLLVAANMGKETLKLPLPHETDNSWKDALTGRKASSLVLPPRRAVVLCKG